MILPGAPGIERGERPETVEGGVEVPAQLHGIEPQVERPQFGLLGRREGAGGADALIGRLRPVVDAMDAGAVPGLAHELFDGLEEVHVQTGQRVDPGELGISGLGGEAIIADEVPHDGPFFCSTSALSFFFQGRPRVNVMPSRQQ